MNASNTGKHNTTGGINAQTASGAGKKSSSESKKLLLNVLKKNTPLSLVDAAVGCLFGYISGSVLVGFSFAGISSVIDSTEVVVSALEKLPDF